MNTKAKPLLAKGVMKFVRAVVGSAAVAHFREPSFGRKYLARQWPVTRTQCRLCRQNAANGPKAEGCVGIYMWAGFAHILLTKYLN